MQRYGETLRSGQQLMLLVLLLQVAQQFFLDVTDWHPEKELKCSLCNHREHLTLLTG
jgi:hypothetical protein